MKIYIIDDDELSVFLTENLLILEDEALDIRTFPAATEALEALLHTDEVPDIILLDLNMSVMSGWEFLDALAPLQPKFSERCSIYILSSSVDKSDGILAQQYSLVSGLLHKPISSENITHIFSQFVRE